MSNLEQDQDRRAALLKTMDIIESGWAGIMPTGRIVDRRIEKTAMPIPANSLFNTPEPKMEGK